MNREVEESRPLLRAFVIATTLTVFAILLWWSFTLVSAILLIGVIYICVTGCCQGTFERGQVRTRTSRRRRRTLFDSFQDVEITEKDIVDKFDKSLESERRRIPSQFDPESIPRELPLEIIEDIDPSLGGKLRELGIEHLKDLLDVDPEGLASVCEVEIERAQRWVADAQAIIIGANVVDIISLGSADPVEIVISVERKVKAGKLSFPNDYVVTQEIAERWIAAAKDEMARLGIKGMREFSEP